ncbi:hypothetical protein BDZ91DRAFT_683493 [Kalaharituber pfeilii]|nr:hypothetical protein BDZ91DRAFT_683493 [Kalaharituber pfeilii]
MHLVIGQRRLVIKGSPIDPPLKSYSWIWTLIFHREHWYDMRYTDQLAPGAHYNYPPAAVLTAAESDGRVGSLTENDLDNRIRDFWGRNPVHRGNTSVYRQWLSYFIAHDYCFGVVHAWFAAFNLRQYEREDDFRESVPSLEPLLSPSAYQNHFHSETIDGPLAPPWKLETFFDKNGNKLICNDRDIGPRRVWDVCANRVVPISWYGNRLYSFNSIRVMPISHAWVDKEDLEYIWSNVNQNLWPVAVPRGVRIEDIREELIRHNVRYAWLDVLCLRQEIPPSILSAPGVTSEIIAKREGRRLEEWETDVPTIGLVYQEPEKVITYFNGLGRPFKLENWDHPKHWLRRALILQEMKPCQRTIVAGLRDVNVDPWACELNEGVTLRDKFNMLLPPGRYFEKFNFDVLLQEIQHRCASNPVDMVSSLAFLFYGTMSHDVSIPTYNPQEKPEDAWVRLIYSLYSSIGFTPTGLHLSIVRSLLQHFPYPSAEYWFPSWAQVMQFPNCVVEPQLPGGVLPRVDYALWLRCGFLYRECMLRRVLNSAGRIDHYVVAAKGLDGKECEVQLRSATPTQDLPDVDLVHGGRYVLVDVTSIDLDPEGKVPWQRLHLLQDHRGSPPSLLHHARATT